MARRRGTQEPHPWVGLGVFEVEGAQLGSVADVYLDQAVTVQSWSRMPT
jgi:hypothetical protein